MKTKPRSQVIQRLKSVAYYRALRSFFECVFPLSYRFDLSTFLKMDRYESGDDRKLFSELIEPPVKPIHPFLLHLITPRMDSEELTFSVEINGDALWQWTRHKSSTSLFTALNTSLHQFGYVLKTSSSSRIGKALLFHVRTFSNKLVRITNGNQRRLLRLNTWKTLHFEFSEIEDGPPETIHQLESKVKQWKEKAETLSQELEIKAKKLFEALITIHRLKKDSGLHHRGKDFPNVSKRQQQRKLDQIRYVQLLCSLFL